MPFILSCIKGLAESVGQSEMVTADEKKLTAAICGPESFLKAYIALSGDEKIGYALFYKTFSTFNAVPGIYIEDLYVFPEYRNKGYGKELMNFIIQYARKNGCHKAEWYVNNKNTGAIDFYKRIGAEKLDYKSIWHIKTE